MKIINISMPITPRTPRWPGAPAVRMRRIASIANGDDANDTEVGMSVHSGTHVDAPSHFRRRGKTIDKMPLSAFVGPAYVAHLPKAKKITRTELEALDILEGCTRVLFKTANAARANRTAFDKTYVGLTTDGAEWIAENGFELVGIDYLSIASFEETVPVHDILLRKNVAVLEGLDLRGARAGTYELIALPLLIPGAEAAPVRAVLLAQ